MIPALVTPVETYEEARKYYTNACKTMTRSVAYDVTLKEFANTISTSELGEICSNVKTEIRYTNVIISPGNWGTKFIVHANRDIDEKYVRMYKNSADKVLHSMFHLLDIGNHKYRILDGQHRILALCRLADETGSKFNIPCTIYPICYFSTETDICNKVGEINIQRRQTNGNTLEINRYQSPWFSTANKMNFADNFSFRQARHSITWTNVICSYIYMKFMLGRKQFKRCHIKPSDRTDCWLHADQSDINAYFHFLNWYYPFVDRIKDSYNILSFHGSEAIAIIACIYFKYHTTHNLEVYMERLISYPQLDQMRLDASKDMGNAAKIILGAMNYRVTRHELELFGETGR